MCGTETQTNSITPDAMADKMVEKILKGGTVKGCAKKENCEKSGSCNIGLAMALAEQKLTALGFHGYTSSANTQYPQNIIQ